jgi:hypothetical protein
MATSTAIRSCSLVVAGALLLVACGGGDDAADSTTTSTTASTTTASSSTTTVPAVVKADFLADANAICQDMNDAVGALPDPGSDPVAYADLVDDASGIISDTLASLRELPPPEGDASTVESIWAKVDVLLADYANLSAALRGGEAAQVDELSKAADASQAAANDASNAYGLTVCGA